MTDQQTRLTDMEYDEVSLVALPANQHADIVLFKSARKKMCKCSNFTGTDGGVCEKCGGIVKSNAEQPEPTTFRRSNAGRLALARYRIAKMSPTQGDVHQGVMEDDKDKRKKKRKKNDDSMEGGDATIVVNKPRTNPV